MKMATKPTPPTAPTTTKATAPLLKKSGPPVPPRPQHTLASASLLKAQRESITTSKQQRPNAATSSSAAATASTNSTVVNTKITVSSTSISEVAVSAVGGGVGRTIIYKSPSINLKKKQDEREKRTIGVGTNLNRAMSAPKPPLKLRKAPDVPVPKTTINETEPTPQNDNNRLETKSQINDNNNIIIVQSSNGVTLNRHNSLDSPKNLTLRDTRLSLDGKTGSTIQLEQLKPAQPLPRPRKIVKVPVATLDVDDVLDKDKNTPIHNKIFRRSKTTLDNLGARANITKISTVNTSNSFLGGKTVEIKNNLKNAAERLFSEILVNQQQKQIAEQATIITKHERAIQHQALVELERERKLEQKQESQTPACKITVVTTSSPHTITPTKLTPKKIPNKQNCTRININSSTNNTLVDDKIQKIDVNSNSNSSEKKIAFHEMLISELAAMRAKSSSMEVLSTKSPQCINVTDCESNQPKQITPTSPSYELNKPVAVAVTDSEDVDADNVEDDIDDDELSKRLKVDSKSTPRKRCPSGCSSDSSPYGTERSRIRTSDWVEVGDNGKKVNMSSCHISLEDSGLEDEEHLSSSGVGDSWDSVKEIEKDKRSRSVQRAMSITELPPLPKSLSGFNKLLGSDSGLLSDSDAKTDKNSNKVESEKDTIPANCNNSDDKNNNNNDSGLNDTITEETKSSDNENQTTDTTTVNGVPSASTKLDMQLATLKKEMYGLRQLDLSLLSQLWALNDSIQEFRTILQEQEDDDSYSHSHSPSPSSYDSVSSDAEDDDVIIAKHKMLGARPKIITTQPKLLENQTNENKHHQKHHRVKASNSNLNSNSSPTEAVNISKLQQQKPPAPLPKPHVVPRMRSAPPPPPSLKTQSPARQT